MASEVEERRKIAGRSIRMTRVRETGVGISQLIEERMSHGLDSGKTLSRGILQERSDQVDRVVGSLAEDLRTELGCERTREQRNHTLLNG